MFCHVFYDDHGKIIHAGCASHDCALPPIEGLRILKTDSLVDCETHRVVDGVIEPFPSRPTEWHAWDWREQAWLPDLERLRRDVKTRLEGQRRYLAELPISYEERMFDADATARDRISGMLNRLGRGDSLPVGWCGWRDYANEMVWSALDAEAVQVKLGGLADAIEQREQSLLIRTWELKDRLDAMNDLDEILAMDCEFNL